MKERGLSIVLVHGMFCGPWVWERWKEYLQKRGFECLDVCLPHHGGYPINEKKLKQVDFNECVEHVAFKIKEKIKGPFIIIGHSLGGLIVQKVITRSEINPKKVILLATAAPSWKVWHLEPTVVKSFFSILMTPAFWNKAVSMKKPEFNYAMLSELEDSEEKNWIIMNLLKGRESGKIIFQVGFWMLDFGFSTWVSPKKINPYCSIEMYCGKNDNITPLIVNKRTYNYLRFRYGRMLHLLISLLKKIGLFQNTPTKNQISFHSLEKRGHWLISEEGWEKICEKIIKGKED